MTPELMIDTGDLRRAATFVVAWAVFDETAMLFVVNEANTAGRTIHFCEALAEMLVRGYDIRDDKEVLAQWRADIAKYTADEAIENERNS